MKTLAILLASIALANCHEPFQVIFQWNTIDIQWPPEKVEAEVKYSIERGEYVAENNFIAGIKFWKGKMYLTLPRWRTGVPVTLGVTPASPVNRSTSPKLESYPSWEMQAIADCSAFQSVQSMEIDPKGRMWVIDSGYVNFLSVERKPSCPPKLVILDLEDNGKVLRTYNFPSSVARPDKTMLNDIVLDHTDGGMAYITDADREEPGIIVYSLQNNTSWKVRHDSMKAKPEASTFMVSKTRVNDLTPIDGIALSPASVEERQVYYSPLSSFHMYSIPTWVLKDNLSNVDDHVKELGRKNSQTDGMMMNAKGVLYFGLLADDAVAMWDTKQSVSFNTGQRVISRDHERMQWPDTFAFDEDGNFYCVTNSLQNFFAQRINPNVANYRVVRARTGVKSYQYLEDGTAPEQPEIPTSSASRVSLGIATGLAVLLAFVLQ